MKPFGLWVLLIVSIFMCFAFSIKGSVSAIPGMVPEGHVTGRTMLWKTRRLKDGGSLSRSMKDEPAGNADLEDYHPIDPSPSSKASIRPGPIQHGTPYQPYIPKPSPPPSGHQKQGGSL